MNPDYHKRIKMLSVDQRKMLVERLREIIKKKAPQTSQKRLVAYLTGDKPLDLSSLREYTKKQLPDHMVPSSIIQLTGLPRLPNGKLDLRTLPIVDVKDDKTTEYVPANKPFEQQLVKIWEEVLKFQPVGIHDNFFEIGGDSILSIQIVSRARKENLTLTPNQLFEFQTIAQLAEVVQSISDPGKSTQDNTELVSESNSLPSDFPEADLSQNDLDRLFDELDSNQDT